MKQLIFGTILKYYERFLSLETIALITYTNKTMQKKKIYIYVIVSGLSSPSARRFKNQISLPRQLLISSGILYILYIPNVNHTLA